MRGHIWLYSMNITHKVLSQPKGNGFQIVQFFLTVNIWMMMILEGLQEESTLSA